MCGKTFVFGRSDLAGYHVSDSEMRHMRKRWRLASFPAKRAGKSERTLAVVWNEREIKVTSCTQAQRCGPALRIAAKR